MHVSVDYILHTNVVRLASACKHHIIVLSDVDPYQINP